MTNLTDSEKRTLERAKRILTKIMENSAVYDNCVKAFTQPELSKFFVRNEIGLSEREEFLVLFLNTGNELQSKEILFRGTVNEAAIYPREIVKRALELNSSAIIIAHNHPSGSLEPSREDIAITKKIKSACDLLTIKLLDHIIVSAKGAVSLAEQGYL